MLKRKYFKYIVYLLIIYLIINIIKEIFNIYIILLLLLSLFIYYKNDKKKFKKLIYKIIFNNKSSFKLNNKYSAANKSLKSISEIESYIDDQINAEIINYEKKKIEQQLRNANYNVILFGAGSCGKTSIARSLLNSMVGKTSPTLGTTKEITSYTVKIPLLKRHINIIDTPGLFEASSEGLEREKLTIKQASKSDLIIFVVDQDLNKYELYLIEELSKIGKSLIIAVNKCDLRSPLQNQLLIKKISSITSHYLISPYIIQTISLSTNTSRKNLQSQETNEVTNLLSAVVKTLDENGEELLADNILFQCNKLGMYSKKVLEEQRNNLAQRIINKYCWIISSVIVITPLPAIDLLATSTINIQMILELSKVYNLNLTKKEATELTKSVITVLTTLGIARGGVSVITNALSINFPAVFISKTLQSITAAWIIKIVGNSFIKYFNQNQTWGDGGVQEVVQGVYELNLREDNLNKFIIEATNRIKKNKNLYLKKD